MSGIISYTALGGRSGVLGSLPSWCSNRSNETSNEGAGKITWNPSPNHNIGGCMNTSTDIWTCPVNGLYQVYCHSMGNGQVNSSDVEFTLKVNGNYEGGSANYVAYRSAGSTAPLHHAFSSFGRIIDCAAGTTLEFWNKTGGYVYGGQYTVGYIRLIP